MEYDDLLELVKARRSTRRFKPDPIPDDSISKIIEVARWAPSGFNLQPWEFVVIKNKEVKQKIVEICRSNFEQNRRMESTRELWQGQYFPRRYPEDAPGGDFSVAPVFILVLGDTRTRDGLPMGLRYDYLAWESTLTSGLASAYLYMHLAVKSLGLGSQWVSSVSTPYAQCLIKDLLKIPAELVLYDMMALGCTAVDPGPKFVRETNEMIHQADAPMEFRTDEDIKKYIQKLRSIPH